MEKINFINNSEPAINATNLNKLQDNTEDAIKDAGITNIYEFEIPMSSMQITPNQQNMIANFSESGNFSGGIIVGVTYRISNMLNRYTPGVSTEDNYYTVRVLLIDSETITTNALQGSFSVTKAKYDEDMDAEYLTDKTYYVQVAVLKK